MTVMAITHDENPLVTISRRAGYAMKDLSKELMSPVGNVDQMIYNAAGTSIGGGERKKGGLSRRTFLGISLVSIGLVAEESFFGFGRKMLFQSQPQPQPTVSKTSSDTTYSMSSGSSSEVISQVTTSATATTKSLPELHLGDNDLGGYSFHDYNGMGSLEDYEPIEDDIEIIAKSLYNKYTVKPENGLFVFKNLPSASYTITPTDPKNKFRFMCRSGEEIVETKRGYNIIFNGKLRLDMALMEGLLTLPITNPRLLNRRSMYVDLNLNKGVWRDWMNESTHTFDQHLGTDFCMNIGNDVVATAPGIIVEAQGGFPNVPTDPNLGYLNDGNRITINHGYVSTYGRDFNSIYCHLNEVLVSVGEKVKRGDLIAKSGQTGKLAYAPHVHFQTGGFALARIDPFRDILGVADSISYWTKDNDPKIINSGAEVHLP